MPAYEVSNHARPGAESRHNLIYWRYGDYVGVGPGAHGRLSMDGLKHATAGHRHPETWLKSVEDGDAPHETETVTGSEQATEMLMMGLRLGEGIDPDRFARLGGRELPEAALSELSELGLIIRSGGRLRTSPAGRLVLNAVLEALLVPR